ncbi:class I SAM-dependent methyltransferase [Bacteroidota bacterium]
MSPNDSNSSWYLTDQLDIDRWMIIERFKAIKPLLTGDTCLEMGPAEGIMTNLLIKEFIELDVLDASQTLLDQIDPRDNLRKFCRCFENFEADRLYDTIIMDHVLEHIKNPILVLKKVKGWLKPTGVLIAGVPNADSIHRLAAVKMGLLANKYSLNERDKKLGHYRVYDFKLLNEHLTKAGFNITTNGGVFLKTLSYAQLQEQWDQNIIKAFIELGKDFPTIAAEIFVVASKL